MATDFLLLGQLVNQQTRVPRRLPVLWAGEAEVSQNWSGVLCVCVWGAVQRTVWGKHIKWRGGGSQNSHLAPSRGIWEGCLEAADDG